MRSIPQKVEIDFTDEAISPSAGSIFLSRMASQPGLRRKLEVALKLKQRKRGASDTDTLLSVIFSLAQGDGKLVDVDRLRADEPRAQLLGLEEVPGSRRVGEYLARFDKDAVDRLRNTAGDLAGMVVGEVAEHEQETKGFVPVFVDGTAIEVYGDYFEGARRGYSEQAQYWQHSVYVGRLWVSQELRPGGVGVTFLGPRAWDPDGHPGSDQDGGAPGEAQPQMDPAFCQDGPAGRLAGLCRRPP